MNEPSPLRTLLSQGCTTSSSTLRQAQLQVVVGRDLASCSKSSKVPSDEVSMHC